MRWTTSAMLMFLGAAALVSCGQQQPPADSGIFRSPDADHPGGSSSVAPKDAVYTIFCHGWTGPSHVTYAAQVKAQLVQLTGWKDWYVVNTDEESTLYYGFYKSIDEMDENGHPNPDGRRAHGDLTVIRHIADKDGTRLLPGCMIVNIEAPDPDAPPEWNLANKDRDKAFNDPTRAYWTIQVGAYKGYPMRKQDAVDTVRQARQNGVEAYYYHGPQISSVCVGAWPFSAIDTQGDPGVFHENPNSTIVYLDPQLGLKVPKNLVDPENGEPVTALTQKLVIKDPSIIAVINQWPDNIINGQKVTHSNVDPRTGQMGPPEPAHCLLVKIPHAEDNQTAGAAPAAPTGPDMAPPPPAPQPTNSHGDGLRSLDGN